MGRLLVWPCINALNATMNEWGLEVRNLLVLMCFVWTLLFSRQLKAVILMVRSCPGVDSWSIKTRTVIGGLLPSEAQAHQTLADGSLTEETLKLSATPFWTQVKLTLCVPISIWPSSIIGGSAGTGKSELKRKKLQLCMTLMFLFNFIFS